MSKQIHPVTTKLVRQLETVDQLYLEGDLFNAWRLMLIALGGLKPVTKADPLCEALVKEIVYAIEAYRRTPGGGFQEEYAAKAEAAVRLDNDFHGRFTDLLWAGKYLDPSGLFFDPALSRKST